MELEGASLECADHYKQSMARLQSTGKLSLSPLDSRHPQYATNNNKYAAAAATASTFAATSTNAAQDAENMTPNRLNSMAGLSNGTLQHTWHSSDFIFHLPIYGFI